MKRFNKQILEAINKGILLALDDYQDIEPNSSISNNDVINVEDIIQQKVDLMKEVVDLGLPSGTRWAKYNLGVNPNQLTEPENWCGDYYAWGELKANKTNKYGKIYFGWGNYKFGIGLNKLTKYCNIPENGLDSFVDNLTLLLPEDDAAYLNKKLYNYKFHIPTKELIEELIKYTKNYWVKNYDPNKLVHNPKNDGGIQGLNGRIFEGTNGNLMFIPAVGCCISSSDIYNHSFYGYILSSSLYLKFPFNAYYMRFDSDYIGINSGSRYHGFSIRPVINL